MSPRIATTQNPSHSFVAQALYPLVVAGRQQLPDTQAVGGRKRLSPGSESLQRGMVISRRRRWLKYVNVSDIKAVVSGSGGGSSGSGGGGDVV